MTNTFVAQTFGAFTDDFSAGEEYLTLSFSPNSAARKRRWGNYGLSADFLGDYFAAFFPGDAVCDSPINRRDTVKAAVSYIANELIENAVKYSEASAKLPISISLYLYEEQIVFRAVSYANQAESDRYQAFIRELLNSELDELYGQQLEKTATGSGESNMGILTMINDYAACFSWKFQPLDDAVAAHSEIVQVNVLVRLDV
ncbi:ATP-binding protein [filamentous cyanobacterium CCP2]|nr:ATP-binding protein [filamentous cyanobacterium CCP2]